MHVLGDVGGGEVDEDALLLGCFRLGFLSSGLSCIEIQGLLKLNFLIHVQALDLSLDELGFKEDVHEPACLIGRALAGLSELDLLNDTVILLNVCQDGVGHIAASWESKRTLLLVHVEEFHC